MADLEDHPGDLAVTMPCDGDAPPVRSRRGLSQYWARRARAAADAPVP